MPWSHLYSGVRFDPDTFGPDDVRIADIAQGLSNLCRYNGQCRRFYSVAEHSVHLARRERWTIGGTPEVAQVMLLHDAEEAYVGDVIRPLKGRPEFAPLVELARKVQTAIWERFGVEPPDPSYPIHPVFSADDRIICDEARRLFPTSWRLWGSIPADRSWKPYRVRGWSPRRARSRFMAEFRTLFPDYTGD